MLLKSDTWTFLFYFCTQKHALQVNVCFVSSVNPIYIENGGMRQSNPSSTDYRLGKAYRCQMFHAGRGPARGSCTMVLFCDHDMCILTTAPDQDYYCPGHALTEDSLCHGSHLAWGVVHASALPEAAKAAPIAVVRSMTIWFISLADILEVTSPPDGSQSGVQGCSIAGKEPNLWGP
jgi:hypothetical protein